MTEAPKLDSPKALLAAASIVAVVAIVVLVIDWQIKNAILKESQKLRQEIEMQRKSYYGRSEVADGTGYLSDAGTTSDRGVAGIARVEKKADPGAVRDISRPKESRKRVSQPGEGSGSDEVPPGDKPVGT